MQSLGTDGETLTLALLQPTLIAVPSLLYTDLGWRTSSRAEHSDRGLLRQW